jgi:hypothetical protein
MLASLFAFSYIVRDRRDSVVVVWLSGWLQRCSLIPTGSAGFAVLQGVQTRAGPTHHPVKWPRRDADHAAFS